MLALRRLGGDPERAAFWTMGLAYLGLFIGVLGPGTVNLSLAWWGFVLAFVMAVVSLPDARRRSYWLAFVTLVLTAPMLPLPMLIGIAQPVLHNLEANVAPTAVSILDGGLTLSSPGASWRLLVRMQLKFPSLNVRRRLPSRPQPPSKN